MENKIAALEPLLFMYVITKCTQHLTDMHEMVEMPEDFEQIAREVIVKSVLRDESLETACLQRIHTINQAIDDGELEEYARESTSAETTSIDVTILLAAAEARYIDSEKFDIANLKELAEQHKRKTLPLMGTELKFKANLEAYGFHSEFDPSAAATHILKNRYSGELGGEAYIAEFRDALQNLDPEYFKKFDDHLCDLIESYAGLSNDEALEDLQDQEVEIAFDRMADMFAGLDGILGGVYDEIFEPDDEDIGWAEEMVQRYSRLRPELAAKAYVLLSLTDAYHNRIEKGRAVALLHVYTEEELDEWTSALVEELQSIQENEIAAQGISVLTHEIAEMVKTNPFRCSGEADPGEEETDAFVSVFCHVGYALGPGWTSTHLKKNSISSNHEDVFHEMELVNQQFSERTHAMLEDKKYPELERNLMKVFSGAKMYYAYNWSYDG